MFDCLASRISWSVFAYCMVAGVATQATQACDFEIGEEVKLMVGAIRTGHEYKMHVSIPIGTSATVAAMYNNCTAFVLKFIDRPAGLVVRHDICKAQDFKTTFKSMKKALSKAGYPLNSRVRSLTTQPGWDPRGLRAGEWGTIVGQGPNRLLRAGERGGNDISVLFDGDAIVQPLLGTLDFNEVTTSGEWKQEVDRSPEGQYNRSLASHGLRAGDRLYWLDSPFTLANGKSLKPGAAGNIVVPSTSKQNLHQVHAIFDVAAGHTVTFDPVNSRYCMGKAMLKSCRGELDNARRDLQLKTEKLARIELDLHDMKQIEEASQAQAKIIQDLMAQIRFLTVTGYVLCLVLVVVALWAGRGMWVKKGAQEKHRKIAEKLASLMWSFYLPAQEALLSQPHMQQHDPEIHRDLVKVPPKAFLHETPHYAPSKVESRLEIKRSHVSSEDLMMWQMVMAAVIFTCDSVREKIRTNIEAKQTESPNFCIVPNRCVPLIRACFDFVWEDGSLQELEGVNKILVKRMTEEGYQVEPPMSTKDRFQVPQPPSLPKGLSDTNLGSSMSSAGFSSKDFEVDPDDVNLLFPGPRFDPSPGRDMTV